MITDHEIFENRFNNFFVNVNVAPLEVLENQTINFKII